jgi:hypothetical protein
VQRRGAAQDEKRPDEAAHNEVCKKRT